jgi:hypothetical protein
MRNVIKEEVYGSWMEAIQVMNAAMLVGFGVEFVSEQVNSSGQLEYRICIYKDHLQKSTANVVRQLLPQEYGEADVMLQRASVEAEKMSGAYL